MNDPWMWIAFIVLVLAAVVEVISLIRKLKSQAYIKKLHDAVEKATGEIIPLESREVEKFEIIFNIISIVFFLVGAVLVLFWPKLMTVAEWVFAVVVILFMGFSFLIPNIIERKQKRNKAIKIDAKEDSAK
ncbi:MAG: hypothetical protein NC133_04040 [Prevotella sp.]|nr:hypothetical protein [Prevotella sp.]